jgi:hypothetical protein
MVGTALALGATIITLAVFPVLGLWYSRGRVTSIEDFITARNSASEGMTTATLIASGMGAWILLMAGSTHGRPTASVCRRATVRPRPDRIRPLARLSRATALG